MDIHYLLTQSESRKLEFKRAFPAKSDLLKTIVAFANGAGGNLIIGVSDKEREIAGVIDPLELEERVANLVYDSIKPLVSPYISVHNIDGKIILNVQILSGSNKPYFLVKDGPQNGVYIRIGSTNRKAGPEVINEITRQRLGYSFEEEILSSLSYKDLDIKALEKFFGDISSPKAEFDLLSKWHILKRNNGDYLPTVLSVVLFGKESLNEFDFMNIRLTRFNGLDYSDISETKEFSIPLILAIDEIISEMKRLVKRTSGLEGARRVEKTIIPDFVLREVLVNAIVHRDYSITGSSIKINIFDDRMEVISPGVLFGNLDISDLGKGVSESRNRRMVRIFRKMGFMEELGTGISRIYRLYQESHLKTPQFIEQGQFFVTILPQIEQSSDLSSSIYELVKTHREITVQDVAKKLTVHKNTALKYLSLLIKERRIIRVGRGKNTKYRPG